MRVHRYCNTTERALTSAGTRSHANFATKLTEGEDRGEEGMREGEGGRGLNEGGGHRRVRGLTLRSPGALPIAGLRSKTQRQGRVDRSPVRERTREDRRGGVVSDGG